MTSSSAWYAVAIALPHVLAMSLPQPPLDRQLRDPLQDPCGSESCSLLLGEYCDGTSLTCQPCSMLCDPARLRDSTVAKQQCQTHCPVYLQCQEPVCQNATPTPVNPVAPTIIPCHEGDVFLILLKVNTVLLSVLVVAVLANLVFNMCNRRNLKRGDGQRTRPCRQPRRRSPREEGVGLGQSEASSLMVAPEDHQDTSLNQPRSRSLNPPPEGPGTSCPHNCQASTVGSPQELAALIYRPDRIPSRIDSSARPAPSNNQHAINQPCPCIRGPPGHTRVRRRDSGRTQPQSEVDDRRRPRHSSATGARTSRNQHYDEANNIDASFGEEPPPYSPEPQSMPPLPLNHQSSEEDAQTSTKVYHDAGEAQAPPETAPVMQRSPPTSAVPPGVNMKNFPEDDDSYSEDDSEAEIGV